MLSRSTSMPSRRSSVNEVTLHTSAPIPKSESSISAAASTSRRIVPEPSSWTRGRSCVGRLPQQVHPAQNPLLRILRHRRMPVVLVHQGDVVEDVLLIDDHPAQPVLDDHSDLVAERRVVRAAVGYDREQQVAVPVLMLESFAVQRGTSCRAAEHESARALVGCGPHEIADPLVAEHRVVDVERHHLHVVGAVGSARRHERGDRAGLGDPLLEDLAVLVLLVEHQLL